MAKRKNTSSDYSVCLYIVGFILIVFITPIILLGVFIYSLVKYFMTTRHYRPFKKTYDDFWLNENDKSTYKYYDDLWDKSDDEIDEINRTVDEQNLARNNDGSISTRSNLGKKLKADFDNATLQKEEAWGYIWDLMYIPQMRWTECNKHLKNSLASFIGLIGYGVGYIYLQLTYQAKINWVTIGFNIDSVNLILKSIPKIEWLKLSVIDRLDLFILSIAVAIVTWLFTIFAKPLKMVTPYPPKVKSDNVDLYEGKR